MSKTNKLREAMLGLQARAEQAPHDAATEPALPAAAVASLPRPVPQTRVGKRAVTGFISQEAYKQLHLIGIDLDCSIQELLVEALNDLFRKYDKSAIA